MKDWIIKGGGDNLQREVCGAFKAFISAMKSNRIDAGELANDFDYRLTRGSLIPQDREGFLNYLDEIVEDIIRTGTPDYMLKDALYVLLDALAAYADSLTDKAMSRRVACLRMASAPILPKKGKTASEA
jgi:hypothetical protein